MRFYRKASGCTLDLVLFLGLLVSMGRLPTRSLSYGSTIGFRPYPHIFLALSNFCRGGICVPCGGVFRLGSLYYARMAEIRLLYKESRAGRPL